MSESAVAAPAGTRIIFTGAWIFGIGRRAAVPILLIALWVAVSTSGLVDPIFVPSPIDLWVAFNALLPRLPAALASSVTMTLLGFVGGSGVGLVLGLAMAYSKNIREFFGGILDFVRPAPTFALIPLFVLWFGLGKAPQIALIMFGTAIILGLATIEAIKNVPPVYIRAGLLFGASRWTIYRTVIVPFITPHLLGAVRAAAAASWGRDVAAEYVGAQTGLGYLMILRSQYLDTAGIVDVIIIYSLLAVALDLIIRKLERPLTQWTERNARGGIVASVLGST